MEFPDLIPGTFLRRDNRFKATVIVDGGETWAHVPNSGRLSELFTPGRDIWLSRAGNPERKTRFDLRLVEYAQVLVSVDARRRAVLPRRPDCERRAICRQIRAAPDGSSAR